MKISSYIKPVIVTTLCIVLFVVVGFLLSGPDVALLRPEGIIAEKQRDLLVFATLLMLIVILPVFFLTGFIVFKYRETNKKATYQPNWDHHKGLEFIWWGLPIIIITILGIVTWQSSHELDPYRALESHKKPVHVQVVALEWKWLFIYPDYGVAAVNSLVFPEKTPLNLKITADAPMNSFWIPKLGGQIYAMNGMSTKLHLMANNTGTYQGVSSNLSGEGFAKMYFDAKSVSEQDFKKWTTHARTSPNTLDYESYTTLAKPSQNNPPSTYHLTDTGLYNKIVMKYMQPSGDSASDYHTGGH